MSKMISNRWLILAGGLLLSGVSLAGVHGYQAPNEPVINDIDPSKIGPEESLTRSHEMASQMTKIEARIGGLRTRAEQKKDMVMLNCVADKLVQVRGYNAVGIQAAQAVELAVTKHDDGARSHNLERQNIVFQKVMVLGTEAEGCTGEDVSYTGETNVEVDVDPSIPAEDPTIPPAAVDPSPGRPPEATPYA